jgi:hypothetical protein
LKAPPPGAVGGAVGPATALGVGLKIDTGAVPGAVLSLCGEVHACVRGFATYGICTRKIMPYFARS